MRLTTTEEKILHSNVQLMGFFLSKRTFLRENLSVTFTNQNERNILKWNCWAEVEVSSFKVAQVLIVLRKVAHVDSYAADANTKTEINSLARPQIWPEKMSSVPLGHSTCEVTGNVSPEELFGRFLQFFSCKLVQAQRKVTSKIPCFQALTGRVRRLR